MLKTEEITAAFNDNGIDTVEKITEVLKSFRYQLEIKRVENAIEGIGAARAAALKPFVDAFSAQRSEATRDLDEKYTALILERTELQTKIGIKEPQL